MVIVFLRLRSSVDTKGDWTVTDSRTQASPFWILTRKHLSSLLTAVEGSSIYQEFEARDTSQENFHDIPDMKMCFSPQQTQVAPNEMFDISHRDLRKSELLKMEWISRKNTLSKKNNKQKKFRSQYEPWPRDIIASRISHKFSTTNAHSQKSVKINCSHSYKKTMCTFCTKLAPSWDYWEIFPFYIGCTWFRPQPLSVIVFPAFFSAATQKVNNDKSVNTVSTEMSATKDNFNTSPPLILSESRGGRNQTHALR